MPRKARIDAPGALQHIIVRGIARQRIFDDDTDRDAILERLGAIILESLTQCYAWALMPNHFHLLVKTGATPIATVMKRLLTGYAMGYNRRHNRCGHLFQNRYKSILCQEDSYLLQLVRYIHLNPLRAKLVPNMEALDRYPYCGHGVLMGKVEASWQNADYVASFFDGRLSTARRLYRDFVNKGIADGKREDLIGGGLVRSAGGWAPVKALRKADALQKGDERILGDGDFVQRVLAEADERFKDKYMATAVGLTLGDLGGRVAAIIGIDPDQVWSRGKHAKTVQARSLLCYWATNELGMSQSDLSKRLELSPSAISLAVTRGKELANKHKYRI